MSRLAEPLEPFFERSLFQARVHLPVPQTHCAMLIVTPASPNAGAVLETPTFEIATSEDKHLKHRSMLVALGLAKDDTAEGLAAVPHVAVSRPSRPRRRDPQL